MFQDSMTSNNKAPINSIAVALLALAVIALAIKEPRCNCDQKPGSAETQTSPQSSAPVRSRTQIQRELGKF